MIVDLFRMAHSFGQSIGHTAYTLKRRLQGKPDYGFGSCPPGSVPREKPQVRDPFDR
jgi:hypothetical protein